MSRVSCRVSFDCSRSQYLTTQPPNRSRSEPRRGHCPSLFSAASCEPQRLCVKFLSSLIIAAARRRISIPNEVRCDEMTVPAPNSELGTQNYSLEARVLHGLFELLLEALVRIEGVEGIQEFLHVAFHHAVEGIKRQVDTVIRHAVLREVVGANPLGSVARAA